MEVMLSSLLNIAIGRVQGVLLPGPQGESVLLPKVMDQLTELESIRNINGQIFPGSTMRLDDVERFNWMARIRESHPISQIVWPGTHQSATNKIGIPFVTRPFGQHQTLSIRYQLRNGVRFLDIRVQQDYRVCNGNFVSYNIDVFIKDIKSFMKETESEIIILEIRTERGYTDPPNFERYLVDELGGLLIDQDEHVFSKTISQVLPKRIICIWTPKNSPRPGRQIWSADYLRDDRFETELPLTKFDANLNNLRQQIPACERNFFYRVENTVTPQTSSALEWLLMWPKHVNVVSKRINGFARLFLAKCDSQGVLDRMQIYSTDFVDNDFITACIGLNYARQINVRNLESASVTPEDMMLIGNEAFTEMTLKLKSAEQAVLNEKNRATEIERELEELKKKFEDEKVQIDETLTRELENMQKRCQALELKVSTLSSNLKSS